jgi:L,D-peptidoglycan transpeptidase YkuD (ErfK/YbiS/YcfS/YnhG family)
VHLLCSRCNYDIDATRTEADQAQLSPSPATPSAGQFCNESAAHALQECRQLIVVTTVTWTAVSGQICCFDRQGTEVSWQQPFFCNDAVVGKGGMGWGLGLHGEISGDPPHKREGDGRAPAGIFRLSAAFGYMDATASGVSSFPYLHVSETTEGVDDSKSGYYNRVVDAAKIAKDWTTSEQMLRPDGLYKWGVIVEHNWTPPLPGAGSCIFLHIWRGPGQGTAGCTAAPAEYIVQVVHWLDEAKHPLLIQLPRTQYDEVRSSCGLLQLGNVR